MKRSNSSHSDNQPRDDHGRCSGGGDSGLSATGPEVRATLMGNGTPMGPDAVSSLASGIRSARDGGRLDRRRPKPRRS
jgi:hypothetical protein